MGTMYHTSSHLTFRLDLVPRCEETVEEIGSTVGTKYYTSFELSRDHHAAGVSRP